MKETILSVKKILFVFLKIGTFAFGGVYSMLAFFERELVLKRKWISQEEFAESIVIGQLTPGAPIVNTGIFIIAAVGFAILVFTKAEPTFVILGAGVAGALLY